MTMNSSSWLKERNMPITANDGKHLTMFLTKSPKLVHQNPLYLIRKHICIYLSQHATRSAPTEIHKHKQVHSQTSRLDIPRQIHWGWTLKHVNTRYFHCRHSCQTDISFPGAAKSCENNWDLYQGILIRNRCRHAAPLAFSLKETHACKHTPLHGHTYSSTFLCTNFLCTFIWKICWEYLGKIRLCLNPDPECKCAWFPYRKLYNNHYMVFKSEQD